MRHSSFVVVLSCLTFALAGCSSNPGGMTSGDPCTMRPVFTCTDAETCDEVYTASSEAELSPFCDDIDEISSRSGGQCPTSMQCCFQAVGGYGDGPQVHCVSTSVDPNYRVYCANHGGTYCER